jgi:ketosteroid isomerase-like protein
MTESDPIALVQQFYGLLGTGKLEEASEMMHEDGVIHEPVGLPYGGDYHGKAAPVELFTRMGSLFEIAPVGMPTFVGDGDVVVARMQARFTSRATGKSADMSLVEVSTVRDGRLAELDAYYKDPSALAKLVD